MYTTLPHWSWHLAVLLYPRIQTERDFLGIHHLQQGVAVVALLCPHSPILPPPSLLAIPIRLLSLVERDVLQGALRVVLCEFAQAYLVRRIPGETVLFFLILESIGSFGVLLDILTLGSIY